MKWVNCLIIAVLLLGLVLPAIADSGKKEREKETFWNFVKPKTALDPVEEDEMEGITDIQEEKESEKKESKKKTAISEKEKLVEGQVREEHIEDRMKEDRRRMP